MPIFQKSIVDKYLDTLEADVIEKAYDSYKEVYSAEKIKRIKSLNEEKYQAGFLKDIFGSVLGYTIDPEVGYNIELEKKNETNSKKADGAILKKEKVLGVIELKSNTTKNLESIKDQAFGYKNNHKGCKYVISSNFHKLRFYVDDATEYEEFDLYNLDKETFKKFYLYLRKEGLLDKNIPKQLKEETKFHEEDISKQLYKDYSAFKNKFFENILKNNPQYDKLLLFKKSQKFLDRILFVLFAEDKELIPTNAISKIVESWTFADDLHYKPLYELFTILFEHLNVGHIYKSGYEIPAYNGGLFAPDEVLDNLKVDDEILKDDLLTLSKYDFNTDVDVNILGHIFEHSLSEIEEIEAELKGEVADKSKGKRKKDGVFYTPKYITKYIVDNTVGKLCSKKKEELGLDIDFDVQDYQKSNGSVNAKGKVLFHTLESYKEWLLSLKILDPACGSGAFLNQALSFLIEEHKNIDDLISELTNTPLRLFDTDKAILENNIFGVDINDESVEIAKLSLWLRTAQKGRKLSNLNNNIKCGNSLIDSKAVAGDKAFKWEKEFPEIFAKGGFDVVIGNPPWGAKIPKNQKEYVNDKYWCNKGEIETYVHFTQLGIDNLTKQNGILGLITPNTWYYLDKYEELRLNLIKKQIIVLIELEKRIFEDAPDIVPAVFILKNIEKKQDYNVKTFKLKKGNIPNYLVDYTIFKEHLINTANWKKIECTPYNIQLTDKVVKLLLKMKSQSSKLKDSFNVRYGIKTGNNKKYVLKNISDVEGNWKKCLPSASTIKRHQLKWDDDFLNYGDYLAGYTKNSLERKKILIQYIRKLSMPIRIVSALDSEGVYYPLNNFSFVEEKNDRDKLEFLIGILNSKLMNFYFKNTYIDYNIKPKYIEKLPIVVSQDSSLENLSIQITSLYKELNLTLSKFSNYLKSQFIIEKLPKKIQNWHELEFGDFIKELNKAIKKVGGEKLTKMDEMEWMEVFETKKEEAQTLQAEIDRTDKEIDQMVYDLYGLTAEEIQIIENS